MTGSVRKSSLFSARNQALSPYHNMLGALWMSIVICWRRNDSSHVPRVTALLPVILIHSETLLRLAPSEQGSLFSLGTTVNKNVPMPDLAAVESGVHSSSSALSFFNSLYTSSIFDMRSHKNRQSNK